MGSPDRFDWPCSRDEQQDRLAQRLRTYLVEGRALETQSDEARRHVSRSATVMPTWWKRRMQRVDSSPGPGSPENPA
jgi:hypothetical protein